MSEPLLKTKIYIPRLIPGVVSRKRLIERLETGLEHKITLVVAPAGYGKTTLLSECIHTCQIPVGWLTLDEADNDPVSFWSYFVSALNAVQVDIGKSVLKSLQSPDVLPIETFVMTIINEMSEVDKEFALVLDDYHTIEAQSIHDSMTFLLNHLPPQVHLVIASRTDPPIPLARFRVQKQLLEVRASELRFMAEEATAFLNNVMCLGLSTEDVTILGSLTEGWIAGLQLAAISMQGREDKTAFIAEFRGSNRYIMDYLIEEVIHRQEESIKAFLLETSILDRFTAPLCNAVTGRDDSHEILAQLEDANLFLVELDSERKWYRYHHLFADLLRHQLLHSRRGRLPELHTRASQWFEQEGFINEAIHHALLMNDFERMINLIEPVAFTMVSQSRFTTLLNWLEKIPHEFITKRPLLCLYAARAYQLTGNRDAVESFLEFGESAMSGVEKEQPGVSFTDHSFIRGRMAVIRAISSLESDSADRTVKLSQEALKYIPEDDIPARTAILGNLGISYWRIGNLPSARLYLEEASTLGQAGGSMYYSLLAIISLGSILRIEGRLHQAAERYKEAIRLGYQWGDDDPLPITGEAYLGLSLILYEWNDINGAINYTTTGIKLAERGGIITNVLIDNIMLAWQNQAGKNNKMTMEALQKANEIPTESIDPHILSLASAWKARIALAQGELGTANHWADSLEPGLDLSNIPDFQSELSYLTLVRLYLAQDKTDELPGLLEQLRCKVEAEERIGSLIEILTLQSIALQARGHLDQALTTLERALSIAEPEGFVRTFVDEGKPMAKLLRLALSRGIAGKYVKKLLASFSSSYDPKSKGLSVDSEIARSSLIEPLSERELEVLGLIVEGMSNRGIAEALFIGDGTVKTHINNIYGKLNVQSRTQAIAKARELKML